MEQIKFSDVNMRIKDPIKYLWWNLFTKTINGLAVNYIRKNTPS